MNIGSASKPGAILLILSQKRVTEKDLQVTLQVFFFIPRNTPVRSPHERTLLPAKTPRHRIH